jgi:polyribonucleotide nucleotidyltransferase
LLGARVSVSDGTVTIVAKTQPIMDKAIEKVQILMTPAYDSA